MYKCMCTVYCVYVPLFQFRSEAFLLLFWCSGRIDALVISAPIVIASETIVIVSMLALHLHKCVQCIESS